MIVEIPTKVEHCGNPMFLRMFEIKNECPVCGAERGVKRWKGFSYDGSKRLVVDCWQNACEHIDVYSDVVKEGTLI